MASEIMRPTEVLNAGTVKVITPFLVPFNIFVGIIIKLVYNSMVTLR